MPIEPGVSAKLALWRADNISNLSYELHVVVPKEAADPLQGRISLRFDLASTEQPLQIDFRQDAKHVVSVDKAGDSVQFDFANEHIVIPAADLELGSNVLEIVFTAPQDAVNRNPEYLFTLFVPDRARSAFPLFDQPDLKARYSLTLETPADWEAMGNALLLNEELTAGKRVFHFAETEPLPSYLFAFVAGKFDAVTRESRGRNMTFLHRETDAEKLARNVDDIFEIHADAIDWMESYTGIDYPFGKFDFVLIPDFPYGGMEHAGAIQYRASSLLLDQSPSESQLLKRAQLIAHETAHMWFGDLVTMRWFDDVWTKEVFANFMAGKIVNPQFPDTDHALNFLISHYPGAYAVDRSEGANPVRQRLDNLNLAGQLYGPIIYNKAPIMMRQLELLLGDAPFREGLQEYLRAFSYGNATWPALISILDKKTDIDLASWSDVWVNTAGMPEFQLANTATPDDNPAWVLAQVDPAGDNRQWPQQFSMCQIGINPSACESVLATAQIPLTPAMQRSLQETILFNANGMGYGKFPASLAQFQYWDSLSELQRGVLLLNTYEDLISPPFGDAGTHFDALLDIVTSEKNPLLINLAAGQLRRVYVSLLTSEESAAQINEVESRLWNTMLDETSASMTKVYFELFSAMALSEGALGDLRDVWSGAQRIDNLGLQEPERIRLAEILAVRLPAEAKSILATQLADIENPDRRRRLEFIAPALSSNPNTRDAFFAALAMRENRSTEVWVSDALKRLHDPSRINQSAKYVLPSLELLEEIQVTGDIFFPSAWLNATLANHRSAAVADTVRQFLAARPDYNPQLRMKILQAADMLFRASAFSQGNAAEQ